MTCPRPPAGTDFPTILIVLPSASVSPAAFKFSCKKWCRLAPSMQEQQQVQTSSWGKQPWGTLPSTRLALPPAWYLAPPGVRVGATQHKPSD
eukprot:1819016-Rhodomonas_salina.2